jgi:hypothetical protein
MNQIPAKPRPIFRWWVLLIPLAVVLAYIGIVYLSPAARDARRREQAAENIRKLSKALESYNKAFESFPKLENLPKSLEKPAADTGDKKN